MKLWQHFQPLDLKRDEAWQLAVLLSTKGFTREHHIALFDWNPSLMNPRLDEILIFFETTPSIQQAAQDNASTITQADGLAWIKAVLELRPNYRGTVPLWTQLALCGLHDDEQMSDADIAIQLNLTGQMGVSSEYAARLVTRWRHALIFEPLTGLPYI